MKMTDDEILQRVMAPDTVTGSEALLRSLLLEGTDCLFGYPGGAVLYVYDAIYGFAGIRHLLARHEQGAIHAADGYARATGKTGVCVATSGPGATNLVTGIATAYFDSVPLVVITGNVPLTLRGTDAFQEADIIGITMPVTKNSYYVTDAEDIARTVKEAFHIASTGRKGPVLIDVPKDISAQRITYRPAGPLNMRHYRTEELEGPEEDEGAIGWDLLEEDTVEGRRAEELLSGADLGETECLNPEFVIGMISELTEGDAIVTADAGRLHRWVKEHYRFGFRQPESPIAPAAMGTGGYSLPAAIGAQMAYPDRTVVSVNTNGGLQMCAQELAVAAINRLPIKIAVLNTGMLGTEEVDAGGSPDFVKLAEAYGLTGLRARSKEEARRMWREAMDLPGPALVEFDMGQFYPLPRQR